MKYSTCRESYLHPPIVTLSSFIFWLVLFLAHTPLIVKAEPNLPDGIEYLDKELATTDSDLTKAQELYAQGDLKGAIDISQAILKKAPGNAEALNLLGASYKALNQLDNALRYFSSAIEKNPQSAAYYNNRGSVLKALKKNKEARHDFNRAIELEPDFSAAYYNRGNLEGEEKRFESALTDLSKAIALDPSSVKAYDSRGFAYSLLGKHLEAIADFDAALLLEPVRHATFNRRGLSYLSLDNIDLALIDFKKALELEPSNTSYRNNLNRALATRKSNPDTVSKAINADTPRTRSAQLSTKNFDITPIVRRSRLASTHLDASGGSLVVPEKLRLEFPAGSLQTKEEVTVYSAQSSLPESEFFFVELSSGASFLQKPVTAYFQAPKGYQANDLVPLQEIGLGLWGVVPSTYNPATGELKVEVMHFSGLGWSRFYKWMAGTGAIAVGQIVVLSGAAALGVVTLPATVGIGMGVAVVGIIATAGAIVADPLYDVYQKWGLERYAIIDNFTFQWTEKGPNALSGVVDGKQVVVLTDKVTNQVKSALITNSSDTISDWQKTYAPHYNFLLLPPAIFSLACELITARYYYAKAGYNPPLGLRVLIHRDFKSNWGSRDAGEWDHDFLHINTEVLEHLAQEESNRRATVAHEYWHAITDKHSYAERFYWLEEAVATSMENEVFPSSETFLALHAWPNVATELRQGFVLPIEGESKRGYELWPWPKYWLHKEGHEGLRRLLQDKLTEQEILSSFKQFTNSLLFVSDALPDPVKQQPNVEEEKAPTTLKTGWADLELASFVSSQRLTLGSNTLAPYLALPRPLSLNIFYLDLPLVPAGFDPKEKSDLIVRRLKPSKHEEYIILERLSAQKKRWSNISEGQAGTESVRALRSWLDNHVTGGLNLVLRGINTDPWEGPSLNEKLLAYFLRPPQSVKVDWLKDASGRISEAEVSWQMPNPAPGLKPQDCYDGYQLRVKVGEEEWVVDVFPVQASKAKIPLSSIFPINKPQPLDIISGTTLGIATQDITLVPETSEHALSATTWEDKTPAGQQMTLLYCGSAHHTSGHQPTQDEFDCRRWQPLVAGWKEKRLGITELGILRPYTCKGQDNGPHPVLPPSAGEGESKGKTSSSLCFKNFTVYNTSLSFDNQGRIQQKVTPTPQNVIGGQDLRGELIFKGLVTKETIDLEVSYPEGSIDGSGPLPGGQMKFRYDQTSPPPPPQPGSSKSIENIEILFPPGM